jgi:hypothetical protein
MNTAVGCTAPLSGLDGVAAAGIHRRRNVVFGFT